MSEKKPTMPRKTATLNFAKLGEDFSVQSCSIRDLLAHELMSADDAMDQIAQSITHVDGEEVTRPYYGFKEWNSKTFLLLKIAVDKLSEVPDEAVLDFLREAGLPVPQQKRTSSER